MGRDAGGRFPHSPHSPRNQAARGAAGSGPVGNCTHRSPSLLFPFKDEKNQVLTTNIWLQMVSGGQGGPRPRMALPRLLRRSWVWTAGTAEAPGRGGGWEGQACHPGHGTAGGLIPRQDTYLGCGFPSLVWACTGGADGCFSLPSMLLSLPLPLPLSFSFSLSLSLLPVFLSLSLSFSPSPSSLPSSPCKNQ